MTETGYKYKHLSPTVYEPGAVVYVESILGVSLALIVGVSLRSNLYAFRYDALQWDSTAGEWIIPSAWYYRNVGKYTLVVDETLSEHQILCYAPFTGARVGMGFNFERVTP